MGTSASVTLLDAGRLLDCSRGGTRKSLHQTISLTAATFLEDGESHTDDTGDESGDDEVTRSGLGIRGASTSSHGSRKTAETDVPDERYSGAIYSINAHSYCLNVKCEFHWYCGNHVYPLLYPIIPQCPNHPQSNTDAEMFPHQPSQ